mmetsp:Transcript_41452/g.100156  ORF Transcript_41452/g.100156 Transcript_41452/m.100156 type:complete len:676 (+) Transcript_41452:109-2136(+)
MEALLNALARTSLTASSTVPRLRSTRDELQDAVKFGKKERANPGRDGSSRFKFTHKGVIYLTDATAKRLIASWPMRGLDTLEKAQMSSGAEGFTGSHTILIVDASGSMRKDDVPGYSSRTDAVYDCLAKDFLAPQIASPLGGDNLVSLLEMSDETEVIFKRSAVSKQMKENFQQRRFTRARSHGNYVTMLDAVTELLMPETKTERQLLIMFLSDGAPSDHTERECTHGVQVWQPIIRGSRQKYQQQLNNCPYGSNNCRYQVRESVKRDCVQKVIRLGDLFGRDRTTIVTAAFGPPSENFDTLQQMAKALPKGSFHKLGLSPGLLSTAFSSLSSSLTSLRTEGGGAGLTERTVVQEDPGQVGTGGWDFYTISPDDATQHANGGRACLAKERWSMDVKGFVAAPYGPGVAAVVHSRRTFGSGAERYVYHFYEVSNDSPQTVMKFVGNQLTAKDPKHQENVNDPKFLRNFCRVQAKAQALAVNFNRRVQGKSAWQISFVECYIYTLTEWGVWEDGTGSVLVEPFLEGRFVKWNSNAGYVKPSQAPRQAGAGAARNDIGLFGIGEDEEEDDSDTDSLDSVAPFRMPEGNIEPDHAPQAFSHFTHSITDGKDLVCDLQGVWNETDGFMLTDPVIHHASGKGKNGRTDRGKEGIKKFFETHKCNPLCKRLGLNIFAESMRV